MRFAAIHNDLRLTIYYLRGNGKKIINRESESQAEVFVARLHALPAMRASARLSAQVPLVPHLLS